MISALVRLYSIVRPFQSLISNLHNARRNSTGRRPVDVSSTFMYSFKNISMFRYTAAVVREENVRTVPHEYRLLEQMLGEY